MKILKHAPKPVLVHFYNYSHILCQRGARSAGEESMVCAICQDLLWFRPVVTYRKYGRRRVHHFPVHMGLVSKPIDSPRYW